MLNILLTLCILR